MEKLVCSPFSRPSHQEPVLPNARPAAPGPGSVGRKTTFQAAWLRLPVPGAQGRSVMLFLNFTFLPRNTKLGPFEARGRAAEGNGAGGRRGEA